MIALNVPFAWLVKRLPRERFPDAFGVRFWPAPAATFGYIWRHDFVVVRRWREALT
jgi:hypothetical protein